MDAYHSNTRTDIAQLVPQADRLLDVGGGTGATARYLRDIGRARAVGVMDAVVGAHAEGLDYWSDANLDDPVAVEAFLAANGPFDAILLLDVLEHLVDPWALVELFARHVRPGGVLVASIPNIRYHTVVTDLVLRGRWNYTDAGILDRTHLRFFVRETAIELMNRPGLSITQVMPSPIYTRWKQIANALSFGLLRSFFALQYFIVAQRDG